jgi:hypothetical protein
MDNDEMIEIGKLGFEKARIELATSIGLLLDNKFKTPALILTFTGIDIMASLAIPDNQEKVTRKDFIDWVDKYILNGNEHKCKGIDIYGARCGLLHSYSANSTLHQDNKAKLVVYAYGNKKAEELQKLMDKKWSGKFVAVHLEKFIIDFTYGIAKFNEEVISNQDLSKRVYLRAKAFFGNIEIPLRRE